MELRPESFLRPAERLAFGVAMVGRAALEAIDNSSRDHIARSAREFHDQVASNERTIQSLRQKIPPIQSLNNGGAYG